MPVYSTIKRIGFFAGPLLAGLMLMIGPPETMAEGAWHVVAITVLMACWWISEAIPLAVTALIPLVAFPFLGLLTFRQAAVPYASPIIFLFLGGFMIALAMQKHQLHKRIALNIVKIIGTEPTRMVAGFITAAAFLSMWISNTATIMMMLPLTMAVIELLVKQQGKTRKNQELSHRFAICMLLGICYGVSIGGMGTVIGTPPNAFFKGFMLDQYNVDIGFVDWMVVGVPVVIFLATANWFILTKLLFPLNGLAIPRADKVVHRELKKLGTMQKGERLISIIAALTALGWVTQAFIKPYIPAVSDAGIAIVGAIALFLVPIDFKKGEFVMHWEDTKELPWGVLLLFAGGLGLAGGFRASGLDQWIGDQATGLAVIPLFLLIFVMMVWVLLQTEIMSNIATITILLPVIGALAIGLGQNPLIFIIPATMAASCGYMMPVATAANAIIFGTGYVGMSQMVRAGLVLNICGLMIILAALLFVAMPLFDIQPGVLPAWAQ